ncbi:hypothetical protein V3C99_001220 [Haemonchus contortus]
MLFIFAVLSSVVAFVVAQGESSPLPDDAKEALQYINGANNENILWDESLAQYARKWVDTPNIVEVDVAIKGKKCFKKTDGRSWFNKVVAGFEYQINDKWDEYDFMIANGYSHCQVIADKISAEIRQCIARADLADSVVLMNLPGDNIKRQLIRNGLYDGACSLENCVICPFR